MGIDFCGENAFVSEHLLDGAKVGAGLNEMSGEGVAESMGRNLFVHPCHNRLILNKIEYRNAAYRRAVFVKEKSIAYKGPGREISVDGIEGRSADGHEPLLVALAYHPHEALFAEDVVEHQRSSLGNAKSAAVQDFEDSAVAQLPPRISAHRLDYRGDFLN